jgi:hypothetical protein
VNRITIRQLPEMAVEAMTAHAEALGMSREEWCRRQLLAAATQPLDATPVIEEYGIVAVSSRQDYAKVTFRRYVTVEADRNLTPLSDEQRRIADQVVALLIANRPGDRERAISLLKTVFDEVIEGSINIAR